MFRSLFFSLFTSFRLQSLLCKPGINAGHSVILGKVDPEKLERARLIFEQMLGYANHVGMYSEQIGLSGEDLGNAPQAFTHLTLISSAFNLDRALG